MSSTRSSLTAVPTISNIYISNPNEDSNALEKKPSSYATSISLTIDNNTDDLNTSRKSRCATIVSHLRHFKQKVNITPSIPNFTCSNFTCNSYRTENFWLNLLVLWF